MLQKFLPKLSSAEQHQAIICDLSAQTKTMAQFHNQGSAIMELLQNLLTEAACNDTSAVLLPEVMLPVCQDRIVAAAGIKVCVYSQPASPQWQHCVLADLT